MAGLSVHISDARLRSVQRHVGELQGSSSPKTKSSLGDLTPSFSIPGKAASFAQAAFSKEKTASKAQVPVTQTQITRAPIVAQAPAIPVWVKPVHSSGAAPVQRLVAPAPVCEMRYVVNVPIVLSTLDAVIKQSTKVIRTLDALVAPHRQFAIIIGINRKNEGKATISAVEAAAEGVNKFFHSEWSRKISVPQAVGFAWDPLTSPSGKGGPLDVNFVDFRNKLFYHPVTQTAFERYIEEAGKTALIQVRFLSLDCDTLISSANLDTLENAWINKRLTAVITSGFYQFDADGQDTRLVGSDGRLDWRFFQAFIENSVDSLAKRQLASKSMFVDVTYEFLDKSRITDKQYLFDLVTTNIFVLEQYLQNRTHQEVNSLKEHYQRFLTAMRRKQAFVDSSSGPRTEQKGTASDAEQLIKFDLELKNFARDIARKEAARNYNPFLKTLKAKKEIKGEQLLYPSENALFVVLFEKRPGQEFNLFDRVKNACQARIWGNLEGRSEGEQIALQVRHLLHSMEAFKRRKVVDFGWTFLTALPDRCRDIHSSVEEVLPKTKAEFLARMASSAGVDALAAVFADSFKYKPQSLLGESWVDFRLAFLGGKSVDETEKRYSLVSPKALAPKVKRELKPVLEKERDVQRTRAQSRVKLELTAAATALQRQTIVA